MIKKKEFLFEICWEVCNKVGGIYTVINSKLFEVQKNFENYYLMGIYQEKNSEFIEEKIPKVYEIAYGNLLKKGIKLHFGKWNLKNRPNVILVEHLGYSSNINEIKTCLWEKYSIDSLNSNWHDFDEAILWSWVCGITIKELSNFIDEKIIVHSHEWMSGGAILYLKTLNLEQIKTIFTTHATMLGRAMSGNGQDIYSNMENIDAEKKAYELNIQTKYHTEKALANISDVFTTVSHITGKEAEFFYKKKPDILLFNGFDVNHRNFDYYFHSFKKSRYLINEFIESYFYNYYNLNLDNALIFYTSGRYEIKNKGIDLMIDSLGKINEKLKETGSDKTIISFFLIPFGNYDKDET
ncbi:hypothetical protein EOM09_03235, partial [bacterium]|nr:hypothetical protein [bacterium]